ncbi:heterokaryon incompatibility protein-domain-containing protein [Lasiosphaeria ovina]|uniref:Heterokaryon incompatibility protein-domain-containing protein n=1 Tax=Lasiosphaeria ovina TaxID=92902 RepID=A0AAE0MYY1_9PEZI|nr:heterokaryon incompatibility protein-domain-containing protein [Lasiosphaeria ovina]
MWKHIADHLEYLALWSLRWWDDDSGASTEANGDSQVSSKGLELALSNRSASVGGPIVKIDDRIEAALELNSFPHEEARQLFLPADKIDSLITAHAILEKMPDLFDSQDGAELVSYILKNAKRLFAITAIDTDFDPKELKLVLTRFKQFGFDDDSLPILDPRNLGPPTPAAFSIWSPERLYIFYSRQWLFLAPVFSDEVFLYHARRGDVLPFVCSSETPTFNENLGDIFEAGLHQAHWKQLKANSAQEYPHQTDGALETRWEKVALCAVPIGNEEWFHRPREISLVNHPHIIKDLVSILRGGKRYLVSEWADGGSLGDYWESDPNPRPSVKLVTDIVEQLWGLADALCELNERGYYHGDLHPGNVLRFRDGSMLGRLKLHADLQLGRPHVISTRYRSALYKAPDSTLARLELFEILAWADTWSMGLIILSFLIWFHLGFDELRRFQDDLALVSHVADPELPPTDVVHRRVASWMDFIANNQERTTRTALGELLVLTRFRLLVPEWSISEISEPAGQADQSELDFVLGLTPFTGIIKGTTSYKQSTDVPSRPVDAHYLRAGLGKILDKGRLDSSYCFSDRPRRPPSKFCYLLCHAARPPNNLPSIEDAIEFYWWQSRIWIKDQTRFGPVLTLCRSLEFDNITGSATNNIPIGLPVLPQPGGAEYFEVLKGWIDDCNENHTCTSGILDSIRLPRRVIDVGSDRLSGVRLFEPKSGSGGLAKYLVLSYTWGNSSRPLILVRENLQRFLTTGIPLEDAGPLIRDAVRVCRELGYRYLWVDSLCILQDSAQEFAQEIEKMPDLYHGASCVLAATHSMMGVESHLFMGHANIPFVVPSPGLYATSAIDNFQKDVLESPLYQRGWAFQDRATARRTIFFTENQAYWECGDGVRCLTLTKMNKFASLMGDPEFPSRIAELPVNAQIEAVQRIYSGYSRTTLTYLKDRPRAMEWIQRQFILWFKLQGAHGILDNPGASRDWLYRTLLWHRGGSAPLTAIFPFGDRVPMDPQSWSWMAYRGEINYDSMPGSGYWDSSYWLEDAIHLHWAPGGDNRGSQHSQSYFTLTGMAYKYSGGVELRHRERRGGTLIFDNPQKPLDPMLHCLLLGVRGNGEKHAVNLSQFLLVVPVEELLLAVPVEAAEEGNLPVFERVGVGFFYRAPEDVMDMDSGLHVLLR